MISNTPITTAVMAEGLVTAEGLMDIEVAGGCLTAIEVEGLMDIGLEDPMVTGLEAYKP